jgi:hypothetical protein
MRPNALGPPPPPPPTPTPRSPRQRPLSASLGPPRDRLVTRARTEARTTLSLCPRVGTRPRPVGARVSGQAYGDVVVGSLLSSFRPISDYVPTLGTRLPRPPPIPGLYTQGLCCSRAAKLTEVEAGSGSREAGERRRRRGLGPFWRGEQPLPPWPRHERQDESSWPPVERLSKCRAADFFGCCKTAAAHNYY